MTDPRQTVESLRAFLRSGAGAISPELGADAADYADMCRDANQRLARCADFLRQGLRGEAVEYAQSDPPLVPMAEVLAFPERGTWEQTCLVGGLRPPARLAIESIQELDAAIKLQEPLRDLLNRHRHAALGRAPIPERLAILRQLIQADFTNPFWKRDAAELEQARFAGIRGDASVAIAAEDVVTLDRLLAELETTPWQAPVPSDLKENLSRRTTAFHQASALVELQALVPQVRSAYAALSLEDCRFVMGQWGRVVKKSRITVPPELRQEIVPLARWLDEQDDRIDRQKNFTAACESLAEAIKNEALPAQLKELYRLVVEFEQDVPEGLTKSYRKAMEAARKEERSERLKQYLLAAALVGAIATALIALAVVIYNSSKHVVH